MTSMYEVLMDLPLFRGVSRQRLSQTVGDNKFHFLKYPAGETIIREGDACDHITFVISGSVRLTTLNNTGRFVVSSTLEAPAVISPDFLFGRFTNYPSDVVALESTGILKISKADYIAMLNSDSVFLLNYLNMLSMNAQKAQKGVLSLTTGNIDERIAFWIIALTQRGSTDIKLSCRARDLCSLFGSSRTVFDTGIQSMVDRGLILKATNKELTFNNREDLLYLLEHNSENYTTDEQ